MTGELLHAPRRFRSPIYGESGYERRRNDAYYTEHWVTRALITHVELRGIVWECAAGRGDMVRVLEEFGGYSVRASDIEPPPDAAPGTATLDFLRQDSAAGMQSIVTNPPYGKVGAEFARHALKLMQPAGGVVALLARLEWSAAGCRRDIFKDHPAYALKIELTRRPLWDWWGEQDPKKRAAPRHNFAWYVWDWQHKGGGARVAYAP